MSKSDIFSRYLKILKELDARASALQKSLPEIPCKNKCFNCCQQFFPIPFLEAYYISRFIKNEMEENTRRARTQYARNLNDKIKSTIPLSYLERHGVSEEEAMS